MPLTQEQMQQAGKDNMDAVMAATQAQLTAFENLASLNMQVIKNAFEAWAGNARALAAAKDAQELLRTQASLLQPGASSALEYWQSVYSLSRQAQGELSKIAERRIAESNSQFGAAVDEMTKTLPPAAQMAMDTMKAMALAAFANAQQMTQRAMTATEPSTGATAEMTSPPPKAKKAA